MTQKEIIELTDMLFKQVVEGRLMSVGGIDIDRFNYLLLAYETFRTTPQPFIPEQLAHDTLKPEENAEIVCTPEGWIKKPIL